MARRLRYICPKMYTMCSKRDVAAVTGPRQARSFAGDYHLMVDAVVRERKMRNCQRLSVQSDT